MGLTVKDFEVIRYMAKNGIATQYDMSHGENKVGAESTIWESLKRLKGYVELKREEPFPKIKGKNKKYLGLTFRGLILALKSGAIKPKEANKIRKSHGIELPVLPLFDSLVINIEKVFPEAFYKLLTCVDIEKIPEDLLLSVTSTSAFYTLLFQFDYNSDSIKNWMEEKNAGYFDNLEALNMLTPMLKPFQDFLEKRTGEKEQKKGVEP